MDNEVFVFFLVDFQVLPDSLDFNQTIPDIPTEISDPLKVCPKLLRQAIPRNFSGLFEVTHPVGKPCVEVERHRGLLKGFQDAHIHRYGVVSDFIEKFPVQDDVTI